MKAKMIFLVCMFSSVYAFSQNLTLEVKDIESAKGYIYVAVYNKQELFMKQPVAAFRVAAKDTAMVIPCKGLQPGVYAISLFHDENENGKLDTGAFGRPLEKFGFSNDAEGVMGAPAYDKCSFALKEDVTMIIHLK
ncbi:MAG: DUF2141 domain-containing protein [Bacteroides sp.]|uniref:DUF2141 domain-containing protein n=1 Tax=Bacteroides sp. TaxID=29523 RepID=UPI002FC9A573